MVWPDSLDKLEAEPKTLTKRKGSNIPCDRIFTSPKEADFTPANRQHLEETVRRLGWQIRGSTITTDTGDVIVLQNGKAVSRNGQQQSLDSLRSTFGQVVTEHLVQFAKSKGAIPLKQPDGSIKLSFKKGF